MPISEKNIRVQSPAKLNLCLQVVSKRDDGYHDLLMLNTGIDLADIVEVELSGQDIVIECDHPLVPKGADNLCHRAARAFFRAFPSFSSGVKIRIKKNIPVAGGLGGGSSNAAATLHALSVLTGRGTPDEIIHIGAEVGADVPFFLFRSPAWVSGVGDRLEDAPALPDYYYVVVQNNFGVSTSWAFSSWDLTKASKEDNLEDLRDGGRLPMPGLWRNDLESVVLPEYPQVRKVINILISTGPISALMSGSGPTVYGVYENLESAKEARRVVMKTLGLECMISRALRGPLITRLT